MKSEDMDNIEYHLYIDEKNDTKGTEYNLNMFLSNGFYVPQEKKK